MAYDKQGRPYLRAADASAGQTVTVDGGFTCVRAWSQQVLARDAHGHLFFPCSQGGHGLVGQLSTKGGRDHYVGVYPGVVGK